jgi:hypothetical protein
MKRTIPAVLVVLPLLLAGCDDGDKGSSADGDDSASLSPDEQAITDVLVESLLDPDCSLLTEDYLVEISLFDDVTPEEACEQREQTWIEPQYDEDDVVVSDITITGDTATAVIGSDYTNITTTYELMRVDGSWKVSCDDFNCDDLEPSAEVS